MTDVTVSDILTPPPAASPVPNLHQDPASAWAPPQTIHQRADALRSQLIGNPEFRQKHWNGDPAARQQLAALDSIRISDEQADPAALKALADKAGLIEFPRPVAAPEISPLSSQTPKPESYSPDWRNLRSDLAPDQYSATVREWTGWAAGMKFSPVMGNAVLEHLLDLGRQISTMSSEQRETWSMQQESRGMMAEGPEGYAAMKADAYKALELAGNNSISKFLRNGAALDFWTLGTLARYYRSQQRTGRSHA